MLQYTLKIDYAVMVPAMKRCRQLMAALFLATIFSTNSFAQANSYISSTNGFWDEARLWSLTTPPSVSQSGIFITNDVSLAVVIDSITAMNFPGTLTVSNLNIYTAYGNISTLYVENTGTIALHVLTGLTIGYNPNDFITFLGESVLISSNSTLVVDGLLDGDLLDDGTMVFTDSSLITTNCTLLVAAANVDYGATGLLIISNSVVQARDITITSGDSSDPSSGTLEVFGGTITLSSSLTVGNGGESSQAHLFVGNGAVVVVTNDDTNIQGAFFQGFGTMTVTGSTYLARNVYLGGERSTGILAISDSTFILSGELDIGLGEQGSGSVSLRWRDTRGH